MQLPAFCFFLATKKFFEFSCASMQFVLSWQHNTIEAVLQRGEKLDDLVEKSEGLTLQSKAFYKTVSEITWIYFILSYSSLVRLLATVYNVLIAYCLLSPLLQVKGDHVTLCLLRHFESCDVNHYVTQQCT